MEAVVLYKSKAGYVKNYAQWISQKLGCDMLENKGISVQDVLQYDVIILGGGLYAGGINGANFFKKNFAQLKDKKLVIWASGCNPGREKEMQPVWEKNFTSEQLAVIKCFYMRGGFDYTKLGFIDKMLMNMLKNMLKRKQNKTPDDIGMLSIYDAPQNFCSESAVEPLIQYVQSL